LTLAGVLGKIAGGWKPNAKQTAAMQDPADSPDNPPRVEEAQPAYARRYDPAAAGVRSVEQLRNAEFTEKQARGVVLTVRNLLGDLTTKEDLTGAEGALRTEIAEAKGELRAEIAEVKTEIAEAKGELRAEIAEAKNELRAEIAEAKNELRAEIAEVKTEITVVTSALKTELKTDNANLRGEFKADLAELKGELKDSMHKQILWLAGLNLGGLAIAVSIIVGVMMYLDAP